MTEGLVLLDKQEHIGTITLNRPEKKNALIPTMILELLEVIEQTRRDFEIRSLVLRGAGQTFCAGDDLHHEDRFKYGPPELQTRLKTGYPRIVMELLTLRKPIVALMEGYAVGAGMDVALACDFRIASPASKMAAIYPQRGLGGGCTYLLPRFVGLGKATELLLLGDYVPMDEALRLNLITRLVPQDRMEAETYELAAKLAKGPTASYGAIKNARNQGLACDPVKGIEYQIMANVELMFFKDAREGPKAWLERREPVFTGEWIDLQYD
jgi:enoyl-CoA hydratase/carnithine racemase